MSRVVVALFARRRLGGRGSDGSRRALVEASAAVHIEAQPAAVFAAVADPRKLFLTSNPFTRLSVAGSQTTGPGTIYRWTFGLPLGPVVRFDEVVTAWVENRRFAYRAITRPGERRAPVKDQLPGRPAQVGPHRERRSSGARGRLTTYLLLMVLPVVLAGWLASRLNWPSAGE